MFDFSSTPRLNGASGSHRHVERKLGGKEIA